MTLAMRCRDAAEQLSQLYGDFVLFSLIQQEETAGKWDIVVSAPWTAENMAGIQRIVDVLQQHLTEGDWLNVARVLTLGVDTPFVQTMTRLFFAPNFSQQEAGAVLRIQETSSFVTETLTVERAIVIIADPRLAGRSMADRPAYRAVQQEVAA